MDNIIAGRFDGMARARQAIDALAAAGFNPERIASAPAGHGGGADSVGTQADLNDDGPNESTSEHNAGKGAVTGTLTGIGVGAAVGLVGFPVLGPMAPLAGAAVGAYMGSLAGVLEASDAVPADEATLEAAPADDGGTHATSNLLVAVTASSPDEKEKATTVLRAHGAQVLRSFEGNISGGQLPQSEWGRFDSKY